MIPAARSHIATILRAAAPLAVVALAATILLLFPPGQYNFYPRCPIHELLHLQCPGCGATRAVAALLRGRLGEAMHLNALVTLLLPVATAYAIPCYCRFVQRKTIRWQQLPPSAICAALALAAVFTVMRNLPLRPF
jgi:hypothetical protein